MASELIPHDDDDVVPGASDVLHRVIVDELGDSVAEAIRSVRRAEEARHRARHPEEGLRERKRRLTRQLISDAATWLFATRGFDNVRVAEVAERVGVSEKTIYNYFPTKESMVLDTADETVEHVAQALRERDHAQSPTAAVVGALIADMSRFDRIPDDLARFLPKFVAMVEQTPALRAAWLEMHDRLANVARDELAAEAGVDPREPEPIAAGRALAALADVAGASRVRHIEQGMRGEALRLAVTEDLERAARLLETGLWSFNLLSVGHRAKQQAREAAQAADEARIQVVNALRQARVAFNQVREVSREAREAKRVAKATHRGFR